MRQPAGDGLERSGAAHTDAMVNPDCPQEPDRDLTKAAQRGDAEAFDRLVAPYRGELLAHCYRMLGSIQDAEDALQETLLNAWRGLPGFAGRSSLRSWLFRIATNACLRLGQRRPRRQLSLDAHPASTSVHALGDPVSEAIWLEPFPEQSLAWTASTPDPATRVEVLESIELAFVAALQHLPATQRAVLILREVLVFSAAEVAAMLDLSVAAVNSATQRARANLAQRLPAQSQQATLIALGAERQRDLVHAFVTAWEEQDLAALIDLLAADARFTMPPLPAWFDGRDAVARFIGERVFETPWRLVSVAANGQLAFACYQGSLSGGPFRLGAINLLSLRGDTIAEINAFLDPAVHARFGLTSRVSG